MNRRLGSLTRRWLLFGGLGLLVALLGAFQPRAASAAGCVVTSTADSGAGTLRAAINNTNGYSNCDSITFNLPNPSTITLTSGELAISRNLTITGPGAAALTVARSAAANTPEFSIFRFNSGTVAVAGLTVTGGQAYSGGGILSDTTSTVTDVVLSGNQAMYGGGIMAESHAILRVERSLIAGNRSSIAGGAVLANVNATNDHGVTIVSSTITGNEAQIGGGVAVAGQATLINSTVSGNGADFGGGLFSQGPIRLRNTIVANSSRGNNCTYLPTDLGYNLDDGDSCGLSAANNSLSNTPAGLDPAGLRDNGGPTKTIALLPGSAALNRIPTSGAECPTTDQRGIARPQGAACDIGAFESRGFALAYTSGTGQSAVINTTFTTPLVATVSSASGEPVAGGVVTFTGPGSGAGIANSPLTATIGTNGQASRPVSANGAAGGPYTVTASAAGATGSPTFSLTNLGIPTTLAANAASGTYGGTVTLSARLTVTSGGAAVNGKTVAFSLNGTPVGTATTNASGVATLNSVSLGIIGANSYATGVGAAFAGDATYAASSGSANLSIARADQSITFATPGASPAPTFTYGTDSSFTVGATATSGLPVSFSAFTLPGTPDVCTVGGTTVTILGAGDCTIIASQGGDGNYRAAIGIARAFTIAKAPSTTTVTAPAAAYTGSPYAGASASATGFGGLDQALTITYSGRNGTVYGPSTTPPTNAGDYTAAASFGGDANHTGSSKTADFSITRASQSIAFATPSASPAPRYAYGTDSGFTVGASATSGLAVGFASTTTDVCTVANTAVTILGAGNCTIVASQDGDSNHEAATAVPRTFVIDQAASVTTMTAPDAIYTGNPYTGASASATGFGGLNQRLTITYAGRNGTTYGPSTTPPTNAGDYTASASYDGDANHTGSADSKSFTIAKASQAITFNPNPLPGRSLGDASFAVAATASSTLPVSFAAGPSGVCTLNTGTVTIVGVGTCTVTASQAGDANYLPAADATRPFQVAPATTATAARGAATYGDATATLTATVTRTSNGQPVPQGGAVTFTFNGATYPATTNAQGVATATVPLPRGQGAGTFAGRVQASYAGATAALPSSGSGPLVVARRILWVKPVDQTVKLKQANPTSCTLELANGSTFAPGDSWSALNLINLRCQYSRNPPSTNATEYVGKTYRSTAFGATSPNYDIRYDPGTLTVVAAP